MKHIKLFEDFMIIESNTEKLFCINDKGKYTLTDIKGFVADAAGLDVNDDDLDDYAPIEEIKNLQVGEVVDCGEPESKIYNEVYYLTCNGGKGRYVKRIK